MTKKKKKKASKINKSPEEKVMVRTIASKDGRVVVGMKMINEERGIIKLILLKPPCVKSVIEHLPPEELLAARDFIGRVAQALSDRGFLIAR